MANNSSDNNRSGTGNARSNKIDENRADTRHNVLTDETQPDEFQNITENDHSNIKGWGIDADPGNDPTYPMKKRTDEEQKGYTWDRPPLQPAEGEVLRSVERYTNTAVMGTSVKPKGLSGMIRRFAYKYSESSYGRWLPLIMADRIGVVEGIIEDISRGYFPNFWKERGWNADWKYDRMRAYRKLGAYALIITGITAYFLMNRKKNLSVFDKIKL